jgi:hypothetical protein
MMVLTHRYTVLLLQTIIGHVTIGKNWCSDVGIYEVSYS